MREDFDYGIDSEMKFWKYDEIAKTYMVKNLIADPHSKKVTCLKFCPNRKDGKRLVITSSLDRSFKTWELIDENLPTFRWTCHSSTEFKNLPANSVAFSRDGDQVAISFGTAITLWTPLINSIQCVLQTHGKLCADRLEYTTCGKFLIATRQDKTEIWEVESKAIHWSLRLKANGIAIDSKSNQFAIIDQDYRCGYLRVFSPESSTPLFTTPLSGIGSVVAFIPKNANSCIAVLDKKFQIRQWSLSGNGNISDIKKVRTIEKKPIIEKFADRFGSSVYKLQPTNEQSENSILHFERSQSIMYSFLDAPSHIIAPPSKLSHSFMTSILAPRVDFEKTKDDDLEIVPAESVEMEIVIDDELNDDILATIDLWLNPLLTGMQLEGNSVAISPSTLDSVSVKPAKVSKPSKSKKSQNEGKTKDNSSKKRPLSSQ